MSDTILVANRGEIAARIMRTARALELKTVAVFSDADLAAPHVSLADFAVRLGPAPAADSYLRAELIIDAALQSGATAIHPGYGFLSESADFARAVEAAGLVFVGPTPDQLAAFGAKHTARKLAAAAGVAMLPGTGVLADADEAVQAADEIGYPVILKATGGGGGIGMRICSDAADVVATFGTVGRMAQASFGTGGVFVERYVEVARHVEVQVFGDGRGAVRVLGDRDCSLQRRHQKVIEEAPAPNLPDAVRDQLASTAEQLCRSVNYRSAGTVEFVYDARREEAYFLEVNARLQVEHAVTEQVFGVDLVAWMLRLAGGNSPLDDVVRSPRGCSIEARVYAEDPGKGHQPSAGLLTNVELPHSIRVDGWIETGTEVTAYYDPLLAKVIATGTDRADALRRLGSALSNTRIDGIETNLPLLRAAIADAAFVDAVHSTSTLPTIVVDDPRIDVLRPGMHTTVQDFPGRIGHWQVGVPPSGAMDDRSLRLGNRLLGNPEGAAGLECTITGPALRCASTTRVCVTGAPADVTIDGRHEPQWTVITVPAGGVLDIGSADGPGLRTYLLVEGGFDVSSYLGSAATFTLGGFGGHGGRTLRKGDVVRAGAAAGEVAASEVPPSDRPDFVTHWRLGVTEGPHAAPEFFTREDIVELYAATWTVHFNSARTGIRLVGPKPRWARPDGGEAGLHPSNIHDTPYAIGAIDYTGDVPVLLGPDGPSLGGFVCPATVVQGERWKLGQLRPGDTLGFVRIDEAEADRQRTLTTSGPRRTVAASDDGILQRRAADGSSPAVTYRRSGDDNLLIEYGSMTLDLGLRMRVHSLSTRLAAERHPGIIDLTPGIRSLQVHTDPDRLSVRDMLALAIEVEDELPPISALTVPNRTVHLPLSWDDPSTREAIARYMAGVRDDAPWCPWNIEFIRRVNGLDSVDDVHRIVFDASYLVLGLGDVYLGAPVATPVDPRHRLVTTKYNPARTWTPENAVGIGGSYLCIYGMEGPGGYQFVGRTVQVWSRFRENALFEPGSPWLLRFFDQIRWYPVEAEELLDLRADLAAGRLDLTIEPGEFSITAHEQFLADNATSIAAFRTRQAAAFAAERRAWAAAGEFDRERDCPEPAPGGRPDLDMPPDSTVVEASFISSVWRVEVAVGDRVAVGQPLVSLEAMKLETVLTAPADGVVTHVLVNTGSQVSPGDVLVVLAP
jgi:urea carboxylase